MKAFQGKLGPRALFSLQFVVVAAVIGAVLLINEIRKPDPGTAKWVASKVHDQPDDCDSPEIGPLRSTEVAAWRRTALRSATIGCGEAGPGILWARFRSPADLEAALRAAPKTEHFVCRTDADLAELIGFPPESESATCKALDGHPA